MTRNRIDGVLPYEYEYEHDGHVPALVIVIRNRIADGISFEYEYEHEHEGRVPALVIVIRNRDS